MAISKVYKSLKITDSDHVSEKTWRYIEECEEYPHFIRNEAEYVARVMTGQETWQGIRTEMVHFTGLARLANKYLDERNDTSFRIKEATVYGNGTSRYTLK